VVQKIVINDCFGGFSLSDEAMEWIKEHTDDPEILKEIEDDKFSNRWGKQYFGYLFRHGGMGQRDHPLLIQVVEELGERANGDCAELKIVEIPDDVKWGIEEYDGAEHVAEKHRTWY